MAPGLLSEEGQEVGSISFRTRLLPMVRALLLGGLALSTACAGRAGPRSAPPPEAPAPIEPAPPDAPEVEAARLVEEGLEQVEVPEGGIEVDARAAAGRQALAGAEPRPVSPRATPRHLPLRDRELLYVVDLPFAGGATRPGPLARARIEQLATRLALGDASFALELQVAPGKLAAERARAVSELLVRGGRLGAGAVTVTADGEAPPEGVVRVLVLR